MKNKLFIFSFISLLLFGCNEAGLEGIAPNGQSGSITRFAVHNSFMYVLNPNEIITYSLADPENPEQKSTLETDYGLETIIIYDNTIYVGSRNALYILGIDNPAVPELLAKSDRLDFPFAGGCDPVVVKGNYAYSTIKIIQNICGSFNAESVLIVYDVSNKNEPELIGTYPMREPNGLGYKDNYLMVCDTGIDELVLFDISNPNKLVRLNDANISIDDPMDIIINKNKMIVSTANNFEIYDVTDITNIEAIGSIPK